MAGPFKKNTIDGIWNAKLGRDVDANFDDIYNWLRRLLGIANAGAPVFTNIIQNVGAAVAGTFDITGLSDLVPDRNVQIFQSAQPVPSKGNARDEFEMDPIVATGYVVGESTIRVYWSSVNGSLIVGDVAFAYGVGG